MSLRLLKWHTLHTVCTYIYIWHVLTVNKVLSVHLEGTNELSTATRDNIKGSLTDTNAQPLIPTTHTNFMKPHAQ